MLAILPCAGIGRGRVGCELYCNCLPLLCQVVRMFPLRPSYPLAGSGVLVFPILPSLLLLLRDGHLQDQWHGHSVDRQDPAAAWGGGGDGGRGGGGGCTTPASLAALYCRGAAPSFPYRTPLQLLLKISVPLFWWTHGEYASRLWHRDSEARGVGEECGVRRSFVRYESSVWK